MNNDEHSDIPVAYEIPSNNHIIPENLTIAYQINEDDYLEINPIILYVARYDKYTKTYIKIAIKIICFFIIILFLYIFILN